MPAIAKVQAWFTRIDQWLHHHYGRRPLVGVAVALGGALLVVIFQDWLSSSALPYVWSGIKQLVALPVGVFGVALFLLLAAFAVAAFVDTSPTASAIKQFRENRSKTKADLPPLPAGERDAINDIRKFWKKHIVGSEVDNAGDLHGAWFELHRSVLTLVEANAAKCAFVRLLKEEIGHAEVAFHTVHTETLADGSRIPLKAKAGNERDVSGDLVAFFWRYGNLVRWLHEFPFVILGLRDDETYKRVYHKWRAVHDLMVTAVGDLILGEGLGPLKPLKDGLARENEEWPWPHVPLRSSTLADRLSLCSDTERQFLALFREGAPNYNEPGHDLLPHQLYAAGQTLVHDEVLVHRELHDSAVATSLFAMPTECIEQLEQFIAAGSGVTVNHELRLRLDRVASGVASGGGSRGGSRSRY